MPLLLLFIERFGLRAQMATRDLGRIIETCRGDQKQLQRFRDHAEVVLHSRLLSFKVLLRVSIRTLTGRVVLPFAFGTERVSVCTLSKVKLTRLTALDYSSFFKADD